jgi:hypothetical protein
MLRFRVIKIKLILNVPAPFAIFPATTQELTTKLRPDCHYFRGAIKGSIT